MARVSDKAPTVPPIVPPQKPGACRAVYGYGWNVQIAYAICMAESGGDPTKDNTGLNHDGSVDYGLMQINSIHADMVGGNLSSLLDPTINIKIAYQLYQARGDFTAWSSYNNGRYREFL